MRDQLKKNTGVNELADLCKGNHSLGEIYRFLRRALDESVAELEFQRFIRGELSDTVLARSRELVEKDNSARRISAEQEQAAA